ncbi:hypothetical protein [Salinicoccus sp. Marseille-QA3877]
MTRSTFNNVVEKHFPTLEQYTPIVARVHGENHPELTVVRDIFADMNVKIRSEEDADLTSEFKSLREVTSNYEVPADGCEAYTETYELLEEADKAYHAS